MEELPGARGERPLPGELCNEQVVVSVARCVWRVHPGGLRAAMSVASEEASPVGEWLGAESPSGIEIPERVIKAMAGADREEDLVPPKYLFEQGVTLDDVTFKGGLTMWQALLLDGAKATKVELRESEKVIFKEWFMDHFMKKKDGKGMDEAEGVLSPKLSEHDVKILEKAGMTQMELLRFELCRFTGHPAVEADTKDGGIGRAPNAMIGAYNHKKFHGADANLDKKIEKAELSGNAAPIRAHFDQLIKKLRKNTADACDLRFAEIFRTLLTEAGDQFKDDDAGFIIYLKLLQQEYSGIGAPAGCFDAKICLQAQSESRALKAKVGGAADAAALFKTPKAGSDTASSTLSLSSLGGESITPSQSASQIGGQAQQMLAMMQSMQTSLDTIGGRLAPLEKMHEGFRNGGCVLCGKSSHRVADCPEKKK